MNTIDLKQWKINTIGIYTIVFINVNNNEIKNINLEENKAYIFKQEYFNGEKSSLLSLKDIDNLTFLYQIDIDKAISKNKCKN